MKSDIIPIVFSTNDSYAKYASVAIQSVIESADSQHLYRIVILYADLNSANIDLLQRMSTENVSVECIDVTTEWQQIEAVLSLQNGEDGKAPCSHISKETYFHIFALKILHNEDFVIYSDCDVVFLRNPADLLDEVRSEDDNAVIYGVRNASSIGTKVYVERKLGISVEKYINAGMFVINVRRAKQVGLSDICKGLLRRSSEFMYVDQDMINMALSSIPNSLVLLDPRWNFQWHPADKSLLNMCKCMKEDFLLARTMPYMIHYTSASKPWKHPYKTYADFFWKIAEHSPFFSQLNLQEAENGPKILSNVDFANVNSEPKVSIIIPAHNAGKTITRCLDSVFNQTLQEIEVICIDDGSTDNTFEVMHEYLYKNVPCLIIKEKQCGAAEARNAGIRHSTGKYYYFLDADDYIEQNALELIYDNAERNKADVVIFDAYHVNQEDEVGFPNAYLYKKYISPLVFSPAEAGEYLFILTGASVWNKLYRADYIKRESLLFQQLDVADDTFFSILSLAFAGCISICNERLIYHTIDGQTNQMSGIDKFPLNQSRALLTVKQVLIEYDMFDIFKHSFVNRAAQNSVKTISRINTYDVFESTYQKYREELFVKLEIADKSREYFFRDELYTDIQSIIGKDCDVDVFENRKNYCSISGGKKK